MLPVDLSWIAARYSVSLRPFLISAHCISSSTEPQILYFLSRYIDTGLFEKISRDKSVPGRVLKSLIRMIFEFAVEAYRSSLSASDNELYHLAARSFPKYDDRDGKTRFLSCRTTSCAIRS